MFSQNICFYKTTDIKLKTVKQFVDDKRYKSLTFIFSFKLNTYTYLQRNL